VKNVQTLTGDYSQRDVFSFFALVAKNLHIVIDFYKANIEQALLAAVPLRTHKSSFNKKMMTVFAGFVAEDVHNNVGGLKDLIGAMSDELEKLPKEGLDVGNISLTSEAYSLALVSTMFRLSQAKKWLTEKKVEPEKIQQYFEEREKALVFYGLARACYDADYSIVKYDCNSNDEIVLNIMYGIFFGGLVDQDKTFDIMAWLGKTNSSDLSLLTCDALVNWVNFGIDKYQLTHLLTEIFTSDTQVS
jgi:hypothetical protein